MILPIYSNLIIANYSKRSLTNKYKYANYGDEWNTGGFIEKSKMFTIKLMNRIINSIQGPTSLIG